MGKTAPRRGKLVGKREPKRAVKKAILKEDKPPSGAKKKDARTRLGRRDSDPATTEGGRMDAKGWTVVSLATQDDAKGWTDGRERMDGWSHVALKRMVMHSLGGWYSPDGTTYEKFFAYLGTLTKIQEKRARALQLDAARFERHEAGRPWKQPDSLALMIAKRPLWMRHQ
jgi:hypothetical protein